MYASEDPEKPRTLLLALPGVATIGQFIQV